MRNHVLYVLLVLIVPAPAPSQDKASKLAHPDETFAAVKEAMGKSDWRRFAELSTRDSQQALTGVFAMLGGMMLEGGPLPIGDEQLKAVRALMAKNQLTADKTKGLFLKFLDLKDDNKRMAAFAKEMGKTVQDKPGFVDVFMKALMTIDKGGNNVFNQLRDATLANLKVDGDTARAEARGAMKTEPIFFRLEDGVWKLDFFRLMQEQGLK